MCGVVSVCVFLSVFVIVSVDMFVSVFLREEGEERERDY